MTIEIVDDLSAVRGDWEELWARVPDSSPFQHPAWVVPWAEVYAPGRCRAALFRRSGVLEALVPAFVWESTLLLAGTGPSDHGSALFAPGAGEAAAPLLDALAAATPERFDRIDLRQLPKSSPTGGEREDEPCMVIDLEGPDGMARASSRTRSHWRYALRRIERERGTIDLVRADESGTAAEELRRLHSLRWRQEGEEGVLAGGLAARHLRSAIPQLAGAGLLRMHRLRLGETTVAIVFAMRGARSTCFYLSGFDPAWAKISPGTALVGTAIAHSADEGCSEADFLRGREEYKFKWGARERPTRRLVRQVPRLERREFRDRRGDRVAAGAAANAPA